MSAYDNLMAVESDGRDAPMREMDKGGGARQSPVALGVACHQSTPEFYCRVLRGGPVQADFERTICNVRFRHMMSV